MIRFDGYYVEEPIQVYDGRGKGSNEEKSSFSFSAFLFSDKGKVKTRIKHKKLIFLTDFSKNEFLSTFSTEYNYSILKDEIKIDMPHAPNNFTFIEIKNEYVLCNKASEKNMYFISWEEINRLKSNNFEDSILNKKFGPFLHKKYQIYYM